MTFAYAGVFRRLLSAVRLLSFIHPARTFLPCSGVGRHMLGVLQELHQAPELELKLLFAEEWLQAGKLPPSCPLREFPFRTLGGSESRRERWWKLFGGPGISSDLTAGSDWLYCPMETRLPVRNVPLAITLHDVQPFETSLPWSGSRAHRRNRRMWGLWLPKALREARLIFTVSEFSKQRIVELLGVPEEKVAVSGNGVDPVYFETSPGPAATATPYVLLVGGLRPEKGGAETLEVARRLRRLLPELEFRVAGLPNDAALVAEAEALGNFRFLGKVLDSELPALYRDAVCLLFLSLYEGFGMPPLEAMTCGTPVICSDRASLLEVVGSAAAMFPPDAAPEIANQIQDLATSPTSRADWSERGQDHARQFTWERVASRVVAGLEEHA